MRMAECILSVNEICEGEDPSSWQVDNMQDGEIGSTRETTASQNESMLPASEIFHREDRMDEAVHDSPK